MPIFKNIKLIHKSQAELMSLIAEKGRVADFYRIGDNRGNYSEFSTVELSTLFYVVEEYGWHPGRNGIALGGPFLSIEEAEEACLPNWFYEVGPEKKT